MLFSAQLLHAFPHDLGQLYDGPALSRAQVAWIWLDWQVKVSWIDNYKIRRSAQLGLLTTRALEVLPGKHIISVSFDNGNVHSEAPIRLEIDAKAGENYVIQSEETANWMKKSTWNATIVADIPNEKDISKLKRVLMERTVSVEGIVQSAGLKDKYLPYFLLAVAGDSQPRKFMWLWAMKVGQKLHVDFFPSSPAEAAYVSEMQ